MSAPERLTAIAEWVNLHSQVMIPDWLDTNPTEEEMQIAIGQHLWVICAARDAINAIEAKLEGRA